MIRGVQDLAVLRALDAVRDPATGQPVTTLGHVVACWVSAPGAVTVRLRLSSYFAAPNSAYLLAADVHDVVAAVPGVREVSVVLEDHFAAAAVTAGVSGREPACRADFLRRAVLAGTDRVCRPLLAAGLPAEGLRGLRLGDVPAGPDLDRLRTRRAELGLPHDDAAPLLVDVTREVVPA